MLKNRNENFQTNVHYSKVTDINHSTIPAAVKKINSIQARPSTILLNNCTLVVYQQTYRKMVNYIILRLP